MAFSLKFGADGRVYGNPEHRFGNIFVSLKTEMLKTVLWAQFLGGNRGRRGEGQTIRVDSTKVESAQQEGAASSAPIWGICILCCNAWPITKAPKPRRDGQLCDWEASRKSEMLRRVWGWCGTPRTGSDTATRQQATERGVLRRWKSYFRRCGRSDEGFLGANCSWAWYPVLPAASRSLEPPPQEGKGRPGLEGELNVGVFALHLLGGWYQASLIHPLGGLAGEDGTAGALTPSAWAPDPAVQVLNFRTSCREGS